MCHRRPRLLSHLDEKLRQKHAFDMAKIADSINSPRRAAQFKQIRGCSLARAEFMQGIRCSRLTGSC